LWIGDDAPKYTKIVVKSHDPLCGCAWTGEEQTRAGSTINVLYSEKTKKAGPERCAPSSGDEFRPKAHARIGILRFAFLKPTPFALLNPDDGKFFLVEDKMTKSMVYTHTPTEPSHFGFPYRGSHRNLATPSGNFINFKQEIRVCQAISIFED